MQVFNALTYWIVDLWPAAPFWHDQEAICKLREAHEGVDQIDTEETNYNPFAASLKVLQARGTNKES